MRIRCRGDFVRRLFLVTMLFLAGCQSLDTSVQWSVEHCCTKTDGHSFMLVDQGVPAFLKPLLSANVTSALLNKGYYPIAEDADLIVVIGYEQDDLPINERSTATDETVSEAGDIRFVARISVEISTAEKEQVFKGSIYRSHEVSANEYMHTGRASREIYNTLTRLFKSLPIAD